eukprot:scaffold62840_cov51-Phaeocystis_antarctica.AAC.3
MMPWEGEEVKCACRLVEGALPLLPVEVLQRCELPGRKRLLRRITEPGVVRGATFAGVARSPSLVACVVSAAVRGSLIQHR